DQLVTGVQTCALPILPRGGSARRGAAARHPVAARFPLPAPASRLPAGRREPGDGGESSSVRGLLQGGCDLQARRGRYRGAGAARSEERRGGKESGGRE